MAKNYTSSDLECFVHNLYELQIRKLGVFIVIAKLLKNSKDFHKLLYMVV